jgi:hypothetical protein
MERMRRKHEKAEVEKSQKVGQRVIYCVTAPLGLLMLLENPRTVPSRVREVEVEKILGCRLQISRRRQA